MTNGQMLDELRKLAAEKTVPTKVYLRMFSAAMAELMDNQKQTDDRVVALEESMSRRDKAIEEALDSNSKCIETIQQQVAELRKVYNDSNGISKNPMVVLGAHIKRNPKLFSFIMVILIILSNVWFISGFRRGVLLLLHVPAEVVNMLAP